MQSTYSGRLGAAEQMLRLDLARKLAFVAVCLCAGIAPLAVRWIGEFQLRIAVGAVLALGYLTIALIARRPVSALHTYWELAFAFFILALVQVLNNAIPGFVGTALLHDQPNAGNPFASTVSGTVVIQLLTTLLAVVPVVGLTLLSGQSLASIYVAKGSSARWLTVAAVFFVAFYVFLATLPLRPGSFAARLLPTNGTPTFATLLALTPALLVVSISNGFEEEFLFRGLFLKKYERFSGARLANVLQAVIFSVAHVGVSYTPSAWLFIGLIVFPLGLVAGYLMRATRGVLVPGLFHGALDMAIYLAFLSYAMA